MGWFCGSRTTPCRFAKFDCACAVIASHKHKNTQKYRVVIITGFLENGTLHCKFDGARTSAMNDARGKSSGVNPLNRWFLSFVLPVSIYRLQLAAIPARCTRIYRPQIVFGAARQASLIGDRMVKQPGVESRLQLSMEPKTSVALSGANVRGENPILVVNTRLGSSAFIRAGNRLRP